METMIMGRYDTLPDFSTLCPNCGKVLDRFQTKDGPGKFREIRFGVPFDGNRARISAHDFCEDCCIWVDVFFKTIPVTKGRILIPDNHPIKILYTEAA